MKAFVKAVVVLCIFCSLCFAQKRSQIAVYVTGGATAGENEALSARITDALVNSGRYRIIERSEAFLSQIVREHTTQRDGSVNDAQIRELGKQFGAQFVCIARIVEAFGGHQIAARIVDVENAEVVASGTAEGALRSMHDLVTLSNQVVGTMLGIPVTTPAPPQSTSPVATVATPAPQQATSTQQTSPNRIGSAIQGTIVPGSSLAEKLAWLQRSADSHNTYILEINADESIAPHVFEYRGAINITIVLRGDNINRTIRLRSHGAMFTINSNIIFILGNNITLQGHNGNTTALINVSGGELRMNNGAHIFNNVNASSSEDAGGGGGIRIRSGNFIMNGGTISGNSARGGGGVCIGSGTFTLIDGIISGNTANYGGGVDVNNGTFTMSGGTISGNKAIAGGGVGVNISQNFIMRGGAQSAEIL